MQLGHLGPGTSRAATVTGQRRRRRKGCRKRLREEGRVDDVRPWSYWEDLGICSVHHRSH